MTETTALALAFGSALGWSGLDLFRKKLTRDVDALSIGWGLTVWFTLFFGVGCWLDGSAAPREGYWTPFGVSVVLQSIAHLGILYSLALAPVSRVIPLLSLTPLMATLASGVVLGERLSALQWLGMILAVLGAASLGLSKSESGRPTLDRGTVLMLIAAAAISASAPFDKHAVERASVPLHGMLQNIGITLVLLPIVILQKRWRDSVHALTRRPLLALTAGVGVTAIALQFMSYQGTMVGIVETIKRVVGVALALVMGRILFAETISSRMILSALIMTAGVVLVLLGT